MVQLSKNFSWDEFLYSSTAEKKKITNRPLEEEKIFKNARALCENVLQPVRDMYGPITISSGYSCPTLALILGRKVTSQHCLGEAADIVSKTVSNFTLFKFIRASLIFDQLIYEVRKRPNGSYYDWVHVSYKANGENRQMVLYSPANGGYTGKIPERGINDD